MTQYSTLNGKFSNSELNKLKSRIKNGVEATLNPLSNVIGDSNDKTNFLHKSLLTDTQVSSLCKAFAYDSSANIKFWKTKVSKMIQLGGLVIRDISIYGDSLANLAKTGTFIARYLV